MLGFFFWSCEVKGVHGRDQDLKHVSRRGLFVRVNTCCSLTLYVSRDHQLALEVIWGFLCPL